MATETTGPSPFLLKAAAAPVNIALIQHAAEVGIENSASAQALVGNTTSTVAETPATPNAPAANPSVVSMTGTLGQYASQYGLLAGGIVAVLIIGTVIVKKLIKRRK